MQSKRNVLSAFMAMLLCLVIAGTPAFALEGLTQESDAAQHADSVEEQLDQVQTDEEQNVQQESSSSEEIVLPEEDENIDNSEFLEKEEEILEKITEESKSSGAASNAANDVVTEGADEVTDDVATDAIEISTAEELNRVRNNLSGNYILVADIDLTAATASDGTYYNNGKGWTPIGKSTSSSFSGVFDGNGHSIIGLKTSGSDTSYEGLFGYNSGTIKNLSVINGRVSGNTNYSGGIAGGNSGTIENCTNSNTVYITGTYTLATGGITGSNSGTLSNCENQASVSMFAITTGSSSIGIDSVAGGIAGENTGTIEKCTNSGDLSSSSSKGSSYVGGICGKSSGDGSSVSGCANSGGSTAVPTGTSAISIAACGGIIGQANNSEVSDCINSGYAIALYDNGSVYVGGIVGSGKSVDIRNCVNRGNNNSSSKGTSSLSCSGGIAGSIENSENYILDNCANDGRITSSGRKYSLSGGIVGLMSGDITKTFNIGLTAAHSTYDSGTALMAGGICGDILEGGAYFSFNYGTVSCVGNANNTANTGGIVGINSGDILECYNAGEETAIDYIGGIAGSNFGVISDCYQAGTIMNTEETGYYGGIAAANYEGGTISNVYTVGTFVGKRGAGGSLIGYNQGTTSGTLIACDLGLLYAVRAGNAAGEEHYFSELEDQSIFTDFDFEDTWEMGTGPYKLPVLSYCKFAGDQSQISIPLKGVYTEVLTPEVKYDGSVKQADVYVSGIIKDVNYTISGGGVGPGQSTMTITGIAPFIGSVECSFNITQQTPVAPSVFPSQAGVVENVIQDLPAVKISKPKAAKKAVTVKWKKVSKKNQKKIGGIEIQVATDPDFTNIVKSTTAGKKKTSKKIKGLTSKQTYWVRIRAYKNAADGKHVSAWKTKKFKAK